MAKRKPSPWTVSDVLADGLIELYAQAEADILRATRRGVLANATQVEKANALNQLRNAVQGIVMDVSEKLDKQARQALYDAHLNGQGLVLDEIARTLDPAQIRGIRETLPGIDSVTRLNERMAEQLAATSSQRLSEQLTSKLRGVHLRMTRWPEEVYWQQVTEHGLKTANANLKHSRAYLSDVGQTASKALLGVTTSHKAQNESFNRLTARGITGFVDRAGRRWSLSGYVEMAVRSTIAQSATQGQLDRMAAQGLDLVKVDNHAQECKKCRPWEGKILAREGPEGAQTIESTNPATGKPVSVRIAGSVDEAIGKGLMHPNCRHAFTAYIPGLSTIETDTEDPQGEADRKQLRQLERDVRAAKIAGNKKRVTDTQREIREHVATTSVTRSRRREQVNLAMGRKPLRDVPTKGLHNRYTADLVPPAEITAKPGKNGRPLKAAPKADVFLNDRRRWDLGNPNQDAHFEPREQAIAERLRTLGFDVRSIKRSNKAKSPDALLDNETPVEFKTLRGDGRLEDLAGSLKRAKEQARVVVIDGRFARRDIPLADLNEAIEGVNGAFDQILFLGRDTEFLWPNGG